MLKKKNQNEKTHAVYLCTGTSSTNYRETHCLNSEKFRALLAKLIKGILQNPV